MNDTVSLLDGIQNSFVDIFLLKPYYLQNHLKVLLTSLATTELINGEKILLFVEPLNLFKRCYEPVLQWELVMCCDVLIYQLCYYITNVILLYDFGLNYCVMFSEPAQQKDISTQAGHGAEISRLGRCWFPEPPQQTKRGRM